MTTTQTDVRCEITELVTEQCAHCRRLPDLPADLFDEPAERERPGGRGWMAARYAGRCSDCGGHIEPGDSIVYAHDGTGGYLCAGCGGWWSS